MGQWGRFLQIKHEAYPEPLNYTVSASVRCFWVEREGGGVWWEVGFRGPERRMNQSNISVLLCSKYWKNALKSKNFIHLLIHLSLL